MTSRNRSSSDADPALAGKALVPVSQSVASPDAKGPRAPAAKPSSALDAHLLAQAERRRGLKAGLQAVEAATSAYNEAEWSGGADRRQPVGAAARKRV